MCTTIIGDSSHRKYLADNDVKIENAIIEYEKKKNKKKKTKKNRDKNPSKYVYTLRQKTDRYKFAVAHIHSLTTLF